MSKLVVYCAQCRNELELTIDSRLADKEAENRLLVKVCTRCFDQAYQSGLENGKCYGGSCTDLYSTS